MLPSVTCAQLLCAPHIWANGVRPGFVCKYVTATDTSALWGHPEPSPNRPHRLLAASASPIRRRFLEPSPLFACSTMCPLPTLLAVYWARQFKTALFSLLGGDGGEELRCLLLVPLVLWKVPPALVRLHLQAEHRHEPEGKGDRATHRCKRA